MGKQRWITEAPFDAARRRGERAPCGRPLCRWCGGAVEPPRRAWCGPDCVNEYLLRKDPRFLRRRVRERDKGVCALCGLDTRTLSLKRQTAAFKARGRPARMSQARWAASISAFKRTWRKRMRELGFDPDRSFWEADHIVPVCEGGGACGLENLRTLCVPCHREATRSLNRNRSRKRRRKKPN